MEITLEQAIEIHARVLTFHSGRMAPTKALELAMQLKLAGDHEGHDVWQRVKLVTERFLADASGRVS